MDSAILVEIFLHLWSLCWLNLFPFMIKKRRRFLLGLQKHGRGDWRNISRNFVISKTPTQVASHAQKYYLRQLSGGKDKRRPSIHDITTVNLTDTTSPTEANKPHHSEKSNELITSVQNPTSTPKIVMDWNLKNDAALMVFDSACGDSIIAHPHDIATTHSHSHYIFNIGASSPGFHIKSPRFYGWGSNICLRMLDWNNKCFGWNVAVRKWL